MSLFDSLASVFTGGASTIVKGISGALGGTDPLTGINPIQDYTGITAAKMQKDIAEKNLELQKNQFDYQKELNDLQMRREDTAYRRKVKDITAAGFNPILAVGGSGEASAPLKAAPAPQMDSSFTDKYAGAGHALVSGVLSLISMQKDFAMKDAEISLLRANKQKVEEEAMGIRTENEYKSDYLAQRNRELYLANLSTYNKMPLEVRKLTNDVKLQDQEIILKNLDQEAMRLKITGLEKDNLYKELQNDYYFKQLTKIEQEIQINSLLIARKTLENKEYDYAVKFYHDRFFGLPYDGHSAPSVETLTYMAIRQGLDVLDEASNKTPKVGRSPFNRSYKHSVPQSMRVRDHIQYSNYDYGVRRNF